MITTVCERNPLIIRLLQGNILSYDGQDKWGWRRLHDEELHDMHFSPDIRLIYSGRLRWVGYVARMGGRRCALKVFLERSEKK
jgi:hypothetical protein